MLLCAFLLSLPLWECGLKFVESIYMIKNVQVTPLVGVWIEINSVSISSWSLSVTPLVGVWIEIKQHTP